MKEYKLKEAVCNLTQSFNDMKVKFEILIETLQEIQQEKEEQDASNEISK